ncbi:MAG: GMC family oxidoreductase [bacterium]
MSDINDRVFESGFGKRVREEADFVVIGTGPSGATAAHVLAEKGHDVLMIEEGRWVKSSEFDGTAYNIQKHCYREMGTIAAMGKSMIPIIQGRCVGGGSVINAAIIWKLPRDVYDRWAQEYGIGESLTWPELENSFQTLEHDLNVKPVSPGALGRNNTLLKEGADRMGMSSRIIPRNEKGCKGLAQCLTGCPIQAKQSVDLNYIPWTLKKGARLYAACKAHHIDVKNGRASGVHADFRDPLTGKKNGSLFAKARQGVVVCASPVQTPLLLWRSGIGLSSGHLGRHFAGHPGAGVMGLFPDEVRIWEGATQGWDSEHYRQSDKLKFEALSIPPDLMAARVPGVGAEWKKAMESYDRLANVGCALIPEAEGTVRPLGSRAMVSYSLTGKDTERLRKGIRILADLMVSAGAESVFPGIYGVPPVLSKDELHKIDQASLDPRCYTMIMTHLFGTCRMGPDPKKSVTGTDFQVHDTRGVYVLDSSIFPTHLGVNPQHTIMAIAMAGAKRIAAG